MLFKKLFVGLVFGFGVLITGASALAIDCDTNGGNTVYLSGTYDGNVYIRCTNVVIGNANIAGGVWIYSGRVTIQDGATVTVADNMIMDGTLRLGHSTLSIGGYLREGGRGILYTDTGALNIAGNYDVISQSRLIMTNDAAHTTVHGNFNLTSESGSRGYLSAGTLEVKGDFTHVTTSSTESFHASGTHKVILSGDGPQYVNLEVALHLSFNQFNVLEVNNTSVGGVTFGDVSIKSGLITTSSNLHNLRLLDSFFTLKDDITIDGGLDFATGNINLGSSNSMFINGDVKLGYDGNFELNSSTLTIGGDLNQTEHSNIYTNTGTMRVEGNYDLNDWGFLSMTHDIATVTVDGNYNMFAYGSLDGYFTAGTLNVKGDFIQFNVENTYGTRASGTHKVILSGDGPQYVDLDGAKDSNAYLNVLEVNNTSVGGVTFGDVSIKSNLITTSSSLHNLRLLNSFFTLKNDIAIEGGLDIINSFINLGDNLINIHGDVNLSGHTLDLNSSTLTIGGDLNQTRTRLNATGTLNIHGNYYISDTDDYASNFLNMTNDSSYITVDGNFTMLSEMSHIGWLTAGTLEVKGDFTQDYGTYENFYTSGTHKVILSGDRTQTVNFWSPASHYSHFTLLEIDNTSTEGVVFLTDTTVLETLSAMNCLIRLNLDNVTYGTLNLDSSCTPLSVLIPDTTQYFSNVSGETGERTFNADGTYTGLITLADGTKISVSGTYTIVGDILTLNRTSPSAVTLVLTYQGEDAGVKRFLLSENGSEPLLSYAYDTEGARDTSDMDTDGFTDVEEYQAGTDATDASDNPLTIAIMNKTTYFLNTTGSIGDRYYVDDGTYTGNVLLANGSNLAVDGTYGILGKTLTVTRINPSALSLVFTYLSTDAGVTNFDLSINEGEIIQSYLYDTEQERDDAIPSSDGVGPALIIYLLN